MRATAFCILFLATRLFSQQAETIELKMGEVFSQGGTQWCWAYSAYHTLRTYYLNTGDIRPEVIAWKDVLSPLNSASEFRNFMAGHFSEGRTGDPIDLVETLQKEKKLPDEKWVQYYPGWKRSIRWQKRFDRGESADLLEQIPSQEIERKIENSLRAGMAVAFCNSSHCISLYGGVFENGIAAEYLFADSVGPRKYRMSRSQTFGQLDLVMVRTP